MKNVSWLRKHFYIVTWAVNIALLPTFLTCLVTGVVMFPGLLEFFSIRSRNLPMSTIASIHDWTGIALGLGIVFHLFLHWRAAVQFVKAKILTSPRKRHAQ
ncbi:MAG TPA: DUF4405 domain-containing protein, partial [Fibrobacteria bacterium]|nr:DUF4405 domain-containing protein [Fibrobacteria bacterium]